MYNQSYNRDPNKKSSAKVDISSVFAPYLGQDEVIEWCGQPSLKPQSNKANIIFGSIYSGFALFWMIGAYQGSPVFALFGLPFFAVGLYVMFGKGTKKIRANTYYAVTDQRCIIISNYKETSFCDYRYSTLAGVNCINNSIMLAPVPDVNYSYGRKRRSTVDSTNNTRSIKTNFVDLGDDAIKVCQLISRHIGESGSEN